jgi:uncharacterized membrane protein YuzA (DUF378 family)
MTTDAQTENQIKAEQTSSGETVLGFAVLGCLVAGAVGILKALDMHSGFDVLLCLLGSVTAFGAIFYLYLAKR